MKNHTEQTSDQIVVDQDEALDESKDEDSCEDVDEDKSEDEVILTFNNTEELSEYLMTHYKDLIQGS